MASKDSSEPILQRLFDAAADYLFTKHESSSKRISEMSGPSIYDSTTTRFGLLVSATVAIGFGVLLTVVWMETYQTVVHGSDTGKAFVSGILSLLFGPITLIYIVAVPKAAWSLYRKERCERCGLLVRYTHSLRDARDRDIGETATKYHFCSRDCREAYERRNLDYQSKDYYGLQTERDRDHWNAKAEREWLEDELE